MAVFLAALLFMLPLSPPFGEAEATATSATDGLRLEVSVEVQGSPVAVLVRGLAPGSSELPPVALSTTGNGRWQGIVQLPVVENILMAFEIIPSQGPATVSDAHTLTELGVDVAVFSVDNPTSGFGDNADDSLVTPEGERWGWLGVAAGAAALAMLAFWTIGTVRAKRDTEDGDADVAVAADPEPDPADVLDEIID